MKHPKFRDVPNTSRLINLELSKLSEYFRLPLTLAPPQLNMDATIPSQYRKSFRTSELVLRRFGRVKQLNVQRHAWSGNFDVSLLDTSVKIRKNLGITDAEACALDHALVCFVDDL